MTGINFAKILLFLGVIVAVTPVLGLYMKKVFAGEKTFLDPVLRPDRAVDLPDLRSGRGEGPGVGRVDRRDARRQRRLSRHPVSLPAAPAACCRSTRTVSGPVSADSSWNTAVSFTTNTNWQGYSGETTMSHFTQMAGLALHNFLSAATGIAIAVAVIRGVAREKASGIGNFWFDCTRAILWVLLPISFVAALFLVSRGVVQNFQADVAVKTVEGGAEDPAGARSPRRRRSRSSGPTAAGSSTPTPPIPTRTRLPARTSSRSS